ncbi:MAG: rod-binding protein, partial [Halochromatium sp.]|uniref:rod-binding protein n=1 Tax=Halochromatium sp. TaxID=2049430 RepID=UPI003978761B
MRLDGAESQGQFALDMQGLQRLQQSAREQRPEALREAAQQFEAMFLHQMIKQMRATVPNSDLTNSRQTQFYQSMLDHQWAQTLAERGVGLADLLIEQLAGGGYGASADAADAAGAEDATVAVGAAGDAGDERSARKRGVASASGLTKASGSAEGSSSVAPATESAAKALAKVAAEAANEIDQLIAGIPRGVPRMLETPRSSPAEAAEAAPTASAAARTATAAGAGAQGDASSANADNDAAPLSFLDAWGGRSTGALVGNDRNRNDRDAAPSGGLRARWNATTGRVTEGWEPSAGGLLGALGNAPGAQPLFGAVAGEDAPPVQAFREQLAAPAQAASRKTGVPAELILAQAALETGWGRHQILTADGRNSHNLFGIKAGSRWNGPTTGIV